MSFQTRKTFVHLQITFDKIRLWNLFDEIWWNNGLIDVEQHEGN